MKFWIHEKSRSLNVVFGCIKSGQHFACHVCMRWRALPHHLSPIIINMLGLLHQSNAMTWTLFSIHVIHHLKHSTTRDDHLRANACVLPFFVILVNNHVDNHLLYRLAMVWLFLVLSINCVNYCIEIWVMYKLM